MKIKSNYKDRYMLLHSSWSIGVFVLIGFNPNLEKDSKPISKMDLKSSENKRKRKFLSLLHLSPLLARRPSSASPLPSFYGKRN